MVLRKMYGPLRIENSECHSEWNYESRNSIGVVVRMDKKSLENFRCNNHRLIQRKRKTSTSFERPSREGPGRI